MSIFKKHLLISAAYLLISAVYPLISFATDFSSANFTVKDPVVVPGAGFSTSTSFRLWSSIGQESIGIATTTSFIIKAGFLYFPGAVQIVTPATSAPPQVIIVPPGGAIFLPKKVPPLRIIALCDFNDDGSCNIIDLSILLYYYHRSGPEIRRYDLSQNGQVDVFDISILLYYWTE